MCNRGMPPIRKTSPRKYLEGDHYLDYKLTFDQVEEILDSITLDVEPPYEIQSDGIS